MTEQRKAKRKTGDAEAGPLGLNAQDGDSRLKAVDIDDIVGWEHNAKESTPEDLARLKAQIKKLGPYKPLLVFERDGKYVAIGGNQRLEAFRELGFKRVDVFVVKAETQGRRIEFSLSDNDRAGYYEELALAELLWEHRDRLESGLFKVDLGPADGLDRVLESMGEDIGTTEVYGSDRKIGQGPVICPNCGAVVEEGEDGNESPSDSRP